MLIGLHGKMGHGKSTVADHLVFRHGFVRTRFTAVLKDLLCPHLFGMTAAQTDGFLKEAPCVDLSCGDPASLAEQAFELLHGDEESFAPAELRARWGQVLAPLFKGPRLHSPREIMQVVGGGVRRHLGASFWIDRWRAALPAGGDVVVDDVRFPEEKQAVEAEGGEVWRLVRLDVPASMDLDPSETACVGLPDDAFTVTLRRAGGVPDLLAQVDRHLIDSRLQRAG